MPLGDAFNPPKPPRKPRKKPGALSFGTAFDPPPKPKPKP